MKNLSALRSKMKFLALMFFGFGLLKPWFSKLLFFSFYCIFYSKNGSAWYILVQTILPVIHLSSMVEHFKNSRVGNEGINCHFTYYIHHLCFCQGGKLEQENGKGREPGCTSTQRRIFKDVTNSNWAGGWGTTLHRAVSTSDTEHNELRFHLVKLRMRNINPLSVHAKCIHFHGLFLYPGVPPFFFKVRTAEVLFKKWLLSNF